MLDLSEPSRSPPHAYVWSALREEGARAAACEPELAGLISAAVLAHHNLGVALARRLAGKLDDQEVGALVLLDVIERAYNTEPSIVQSAACDLLAAVDRDPACQGFLKPFLFYKGYQALQTYRVAHWLWRSGRRALAHHLQSRASALFHVDIHPAAQIGRGVFVDHGTEIIIGETVKIGDDVSILQGVTLGGNGVEAKPRHPTIGVGVSLLAGAKVLGDVAIGDYAKVGAGSLVLRDVPAGCTAVGVPARLVNCPSQEVEDVPR
ncbi:MAG: serine O-acetyltransferase [Phenylobacterium sp.]|uniref:serine O-acetyltransferase n=1 Tax=Phenylobacterium sp. TaxID=1871053 RepID=UPI003919ACCD